MNTPRPTPLTFRERLLKAAELINTNSPTMILPKVLVDAVDALLNRDIELPGAIEEEPLAVDGVEVPVFRAALLGPSRIGKTSLVAAMLRAGEQSLDGTQLVLRPADDRTDSLIRSNQRGLHAGLERGRFKTQTIKQTAEKTYFRLSLRHVQDERGIEFSLLDFPGRLFEDARNVDADGRTLLTPDLAAEWKDIRDYLTECNVLIIPVDAMAVMEAVLERQLRSVPGILEIDSIATIVEEWTRVRQGRDSEPALVVIAPVKGESYFPEGAGIDRSDELRHRTLNHYQRCIDIVQRGAPHATVLYCPVDTLGNVQLVRTQWVSPEDRKDDLIVPVGVFAVRRDPRSGSAFAPIKVVGAQDILIEICRMLAESQVKISAAIAALHDKDRDRYRRLKVDLSSGFFRRNWNVYQRRVATADALSTLSGTQANDERQRAAYLAKEVQKIAARDLGARSSRL